MRSWKNIAFALSIFGWSIPPGIPYHSIMGDRGHGDTSNSSDGIVPYWSSHLSDHGGQYNPQAIREVARILKESRSFQ